MKKILVTGGAGFIGSALVQILADSNYEIIILDKMGYASNSKFAENMCSRLSNVSLIVGDISERPLLRELLHDKGIDSIIHLAAESHVDNSIASPKPFVDSNIIGTYNILESIRELKQTTGRSVRLIHVSTDEVYGDLDLNKSPFTELSPYRPSSPYAATKAAADHLVKSWSRTYGIDAIVTNCSNNFGPRQHREKLIPKLILNAIAGKNLPLYGNGLQIRDWLYVTDHCDGLIRVLEGGVSGSTYNIGGKCECTNLSIANRVMFEVSLQTAKPCTSIIEYIADRPGHDKRYAINANKISRELGWKRVTKFNKSIENTVSWYINNN